MLSSPKHNVCIEMMWNQNISVCMGCFFLRYTEQKLQWRIVSHRFPERTWRNSERPLIKLVSFSLSHTYTHCCFLVQSTSFTTAHKIWLLRKGFLLLQCWGQALGLCELSNIGGWLHFISSPNHPECMITKMCLKMCHIKSKPFIMRLRCWIFKSCPTITSSAVLCASLHSAKHRLSMMRCKVWQLSSWKFQ